MPEIRNIALVGHGDAGKTTLMEHLLATGKAIARAGTVNDGSTVSDYEEEEHERKSSVQLGVGHTLWNKVHLNLIDAPGYPDFQGEAVAAMSVAETALIAVPATGGVGVGARRAWGTSGKMALARAIVVTKADHENAKVEETIAAIRESFGSTCVPAVSVDGTGSTFKGVTRVLGTDDGESLTERIVEADDALLERYLEGEVISKDELAATFGRAMTAGNVVPIYVVSAEQDLGVKALADAMVDVFPAPGKAPAATTKGSGDAHELNTAADGEACARVFKVFTDPYVGRICFLRVYGGTLNAESHLINARSAKTEKIPGYNRIQGKELSALNEASAGDIVAIVKVESTDRDDTLSDSGEVCVSPPPYPDPMVTRAVEPKARADEAKLGEAVKKLCDEDPTFLFRRDPVTKEQVISGLSELHIDVMLRRALRRSKVELVTKMPRIAYRETVTGTHETRYRHKKQSGGSGQFAEVWLRVAPAERGAGFEFGDETVGGSIPKQFIPSIEKGIKPVLEGGAVAGYPVVDVKAVVFDGKHHPVDSKDVAFQIAGRQAFKECIRNAKPMLLEPIANIEITVPSKYMGDITSDLSGRRGRMQGMDAEGDLQIIQAQVPVAEIQKYSSELRSLTSGEGAFTMEPSHYDIVPSNIAQGIIEGAAEAMKEADAKDA